MPTAVASAMPPQLPQMMSQHEVSPKSSYPVLAPSSHSPPSNERRTPASANVSQPAVSEGAGPQKPSPDGKRTSPQSARAGHPPKIIVKKEPSSPEVPQTSRHRPRKLDLTASNNDAPAGSSRPSAPLTRDSANLGMHDVGLACLSPGFQTQDPSMQEQLQRSIEVQRQQRSIIESRLQKNAKGTDSAGEREQHAFASAGLRTPMTSTKKRPPPGLSIVPPSHEQFANERVIQSAPLHQTFTGRHQPPHLARHTANDSSHMHHAPAVQTQNRLPPISDVFANEGLGSHREALNSAGQAGSAAARPGFFHSNSATNPSQSAHRPAFPSPGLPPPRSEQGPPPPNMNRPRDYRSAEEAVAEMTAGREDLRPKLVHYGGHQPPTPPSPPSGHGMTPNNHPTSHAGGDIGRNASGRRRPRAEYERDGSPPLGSGPSPRRAFGERDSPETNLRKKDEFMRLCARAWDLFHS